MFSLSWSFSLDQQWVMSSIAVCKVCRMRWSCCRLSMHPALIFGILSAALAADYIKCIRIVCACEIGKLQCRWKIVRQGRLLCNRGGVGSGVVVGRGGVGSLGVEMAFARADSQTFPQITLPNYQMNILIDSCFFGMIFTEPRGHKNMRTWRTHMVHV